MLNNSISPCGDSDIKMSYFIFCTLLKNIVLRSVSIFLYLILQETFFPVVPY